MHGQVQKESQLPRAAQATRIVDPSACKLSGLTIGFIPASRIDA